MTQQEALKQINIHLDAAYACIKEAEKIADEAGVSFSFDLAYGMGGYYTPPKLADEDYGEVGWNSSSSRC